MKSNFNFKEARLSLGLNQSQMSKSLGVHRQTWVKWERGERKPDAVAIRLIDTLLWLNSINMLSDYLEYF